MAGEPLRILQILRAPVGGLFRHVGDLTLGLAERGHQIGIVVDSLSADALTTERLDVLRPVAKLGIHSVPMPRVLGPGDLTTPFRIRSLAGELQAQVLHGHGAKGGLNARLAAAGVQERVALYTTHGGVLHFPPNSPSGLLFQNFERLLLPLTDAVIFESAFARQKFHELIGLPRCPDPVIHNGLKPAEFEPIAPAPDAADFVFIGEFRALKGTQVLVEALAGVHAPDGRPATLVMAGGGPDIEAFKQRVAALGLGERVTLLGVQPARPTLHRGRCAVVPSLKESLPYVVLEAAAAARPVIATNVGGIPEIFGPTASNLVAPDDVAALGAAMQAFMDNPARADDEMRMRLRHVQEHFSMDRMVTAIETLYRQVLAAR
jgi:glycosyltransferase involved in cell wall biosynthesis